MDMKDFPVQAVYGVVAIAGGVARYLNSFTHGTKFNWRIFIASALVSGFSGYMFALVGDSLSLPYPLPHIMAGCGGFFGDQTMKLVLEYVSSKTIVQGNIVTVDPIPPTTITTE